MKRGALGLLAAGLLATGLLAQGASAQERAPADRSALADLAYALGEAHALHRVCAGPRDATWYARMQKLIAVERPDEGLRRRLVESFNAGYMTRRAEFPSCGPAVHDAERDAAAKGRALAKALAH